MASSNRHWPSMFKSKPCNPQSQWQHDINPSLLSGYTYINPYTSGVQERSPEPKPRWNPKPEQIRILESIFNSGMVNPPRDEIRKIRAQLQEYGQVGDANVFYWFQNRKSRTKHKNRQLSKQLNKSSRTATSITNTNIVTPSMITNPSSSSSSSDKSSSNLHFNKRKTSPNDLNLGSNFLNQLACSSTASTNQTTYVHVVQHEPFMFPLQQLSNSTQGFTGFHDHPSQYSQPLNMMMPNYMNNSAINIPHSVGPCSEFLFSELMSNEHGESVNNKDVGDEETLMMMKLGYPNSASASSLAPNSVPISTATIAPFQDDSCASTVVGPIKSTVFFNDVAFEVDCGPFNVRNAFGNDAVLLHSTGQPVLTNEWGVTVQPLEHAAFYYVI